MAASMALSPWFSTQGQLVLLALAAIGFDLGVQATLVAHQTIVYSIEPGARSRLNAVLFVGMFIDLPAAVLLLTPVFNEVLGRVVRVRSAVWMCVPAMRPCTRPCELTSMNTTLQPASLMRAKWP